MDLKLYNRTPVDFEGVDTSTLNSLPNDKILNQSRLKAFADDNLNVN